MPDFLTITVQAQIAFGLAMVALLLVYIAFFKGPGGKSDHSGHGQPR